MMSSQPWALRRKKHSGFQCNLVNPAPLVLEAQGRPSLERPLPISSFIEMTHKDTSDFVQVLKKEKQILYGKNAASL